MTGQIVIHNAAARKWMHFAHPHQIVSVHAIREVLPALEKVESLVERNHWYAAGFVSYEASSAFDPAIVTCDADNFPLLWFGLYPEPGVMDLPKPDFRAYSLGTPAPSLSLSEYGPAIDRVKDYIRSGDTYQVNYTIRMHMPFAGDAWQLFLAMVRAQSPGYAAWIDTGRYAICSASPELFFKLEGNTISCKPMKGTVKRGRTQREDVELSRWLQNSEKNRAENLMIVDMIRNDLGRVAVTGSVRVPRLFEVERHPTLWQMTSTVTAECTKPVSTLFQALFPCASITGAPKVRTTKIIAELEQRRRGLYTGCIGFIAPDRWAQFSVAIRTTVVDRDSGQAEYGSGGGIVWDSASEDEYREALLKSRVLTEQRPEFCLLETLLWTPDEGYFLLEYHLKRLSESAEYFGFEYPAAAREKLLEYAKRFDVRAQRVRLLAESGGALRIEASEMECASALPVRIKPAREPVDTSDVFLYHKTTHRSVYEKALSSCSGCDDVLLWNENGEVTESTIANVVVEMEGKLITPPLSSGLLAGTFRAFLLDEGTIQEQVIRIEDLPRCSRIFLINSVRKWREAVLVN